MTIIRMHMLRHCCIDVHATYVYYHHFNVVVLNDQLQCTVRCYLLFFLLDIRETY